MDNPADIVPHPFPSLFAMTPRCISVSERRSGDVLAHTDITTHPCDFATVESDISTFVALPPHYHLNLPAGTALGQAHGVWDEVLHNYGEVMVLGTTTRHQSLPTPVGQKMQAFFFTEWMPDKKHANVSPNATQLNPPTVPQLKNFGGIWG